jgi:hypothetical protein
MTNDGLPELPASQANVEVWDSEVRGLHQANAAYYTADQMQDYARAAIAQERERIAQMADQRGAEAWSLGASRESGMWECFAAEVRGQAEGERGQPSARTEAK